MPTKKIEQALILMGKVSSLLKDAKKQLSSSSATSLNKSSLLEGNWPIAVNPNLICAVDNEKDKKDRANGVVELMIEENLNDKKLLDYGCGEGHTAEVATLHNTVISVGYDIVENENWSKRSGENLHLTKDMNLVKNNAPYDVIIMFDVLDHVAPYDDLKAPAKVLQEVSEMLAPKGKIYIRYHPWTARHSTHMYHWMNKAYIHMVYTNEELDEMGVKVGEPIQKVTRPVVTYQQWIKAAGLKIDNERIIKEPVEEFFKTPEIKERIKKNTGLRENGKDLQFPEFQMSIQFIDYILSK